MLNRGFTFVEIIIAITVILVGVGIYALVPRIVEEVAFNYDRFVAVQLSREGIELVRALRDNNWLERYEILDNSWKEGLTNCSNGCEMDYTALADKNPPHSTFITWLGTGHYLKINANGFYNYIAGNPSKFKRKITITDLVSPPTPAAAGHVLEVKVEVFWPDYSIAPSPKNYVVMQEQLYNWRGDPE